MKHHKLTVALVGFLLLVTGAVASRYVWPTPVATADNLRMDEQELTIRAINKVMPAVVIVNVFSPVRADVNGKIQESKKFEGTGTGFLVTADGLILTNKHVVNVTPRAKYEVVTTAGKTYQAQLIGRDPINDLAVLKINVKGLPFVQMGDSHNSPVGTTVLAIGNVLGKYSNSVTKGIISGKGRSIVASLDGENYEDLDNVLQTDAQINKGNSGGPLIDLNGKVVGVNVAMDQSGVSVGFAIPIDDAKPVVESTIKYGRIIRSRMGVRYYMLTPDLAAEKKLTQTSGALLDTNEQGDPAVLAKGPADKAGLKQGDVIVKLEGKAVNLDWNLSSLVSQYHPGDKVKLEVIRGGKTMNFTVTLDEFPGV